LKVVVNLHAFGNLLIVPFNFDGPENTSLLGKFPSASNFYDHLWVDGGLPSGNIKGNGAVGVKYSANGEASDYLLAEKGIYSLSPELGIADSSSNTFIIKQFSDLLRVVTQNYNWLLYTIKQLHPSVSFSFVKMNQSEQKKIL